MANRPGHADGSLWPVAVYPHEFIASRSCILPLAFTGIYVLYRLMTWQPSAPTKNEEKMPAADSSACENGKALEDGTPAEAGQPPPTDLIRGKRVHLARVLQFAIYLAAMDLFQAAAPCLGCTASVRDLPLLGTRDFPLFDTSLVFPAFTLSLAIGGKLKFVTNQMFQPRTWSNVRRFAIAVLDRVAWLVGTQGTVWLFAHAWQSAIPAPTEKTRCTPPGERRKFGQIGDCAQQLWFSEWRHPILLCEPVAVPAFILPLLWSAIFVSLRSRLRRRAFVIERDEPAAEVQSTAHGLLVVVSLLGSLVLGGALTTYGASCLGWDSMCFSVPPQRPQIVTLFGIVIWGPIFLFLWIFKSLAVEDRLGVPKELVPWRAHVWTGLGTASDVLAVQCTLWLVLRGYEAVTTGELL